jgi:putative ABC transport system permease protein
MDSFFRITRLFDGVILAVSAATLLALGLVFSLSLRLRRREMETSRHIGCSRLFGVKLVLAELVLLLLAAGLVSFGLITLFDGLCSGWVRMMWWPQGGGDD